jgi:hypothetical protein
MGKVIASSEPDSDRLSEKSGVHPNADDDSEDNLHAMEVVWNGQWIETGWADVAASSWWTGGGRGHVEWETRQGRRRPNPQGYGDSPSQGDEKPGESSKAA